MMCLSVLGCRVTSLPYDWLPVLKKAGSLLATPFEKQAHAKAKYGGENFFSAVYQRRSLRFTAEQVTASIGVNWYNMQSRRS